jgi:O-antigen ligase
VADPTKSNVEKIGFWLTIVCAIHCVATPILITFLPLFGSKFAMFHQYENIFLGISLLLAIYLLGRDYREHKNVVPMKLVAIAAMVKLVDLIFLDQSLELLVSFSMASLIIWAYWLNWKHKQKCRCHIAH